MITTIFSFFTYFSLVALLLGSPQNSPNIMIKNKLIKIKGHYVFRTFQFFSIPFQQRQDVFIFGFLFLVNILLFQDFFDHYNQQFCKSQIKMIFCLYFCKALQTLIVVWVINALKSLLSYEPRFNNKKQNNLNRLDKIIPHSLLEYPNKKITTTVNSQILIRVKKQRNTKQNTIKIVIWRIHRGYFKAPINGNYTFLFHIFKESQQFIIHVNIHSKIIFQQQTVFWNHKMEIQFVKLVKIFCR
ncbi:hypothetical protein pb186bvf_019089 [Paramecium bursaria]